MLSNNPDVSVIICNHVVGPLFYLATTSLRMQKNIKFEIIVITSSKELFKAGVADCRVLYLNKTPAEKRNFGAREAKGQYLAFFDDDVDINELCLTELLKPLVMNETVGMTYGKLWNMEHQNRFDEAGGYLTSSGFIWSRAGQNDVDEGQFNAIEPVLAGKSASCMVKKDLFLALGGFDEDFGILGEETDLSWRIWLSGNEVWYVPNATGLHAFNTKFKPVEKHYTTSRVQYNGCRNYITMLIKNLEARNLWKILPIHMACWFTASLAMIITGKVRQGLSIWRGFGYIVLKVGLLRAKRKAVQEGRKVDDRTLWPDIFRRPPRGYYRTRILRYITLGLHG